MLESGQASLYAGRQSAMLVEVVEYPQWRGLHIFLAGGDLDELRGMLPLLEAAAKSAGCTKIGLTGRPGWVRALKTCGYAHKAAVVEKELA